MNLSNFIDLAGGAITSFPVLFATETSTVVVAFSSYRQATASIQNAERRAYTAIPLFILEV